MTSLQRPELPVGTWKQSSLLWSSQNTTWDPTWFAMTMNIAQGKIFFLDFLACRYPCKALWPNPTWICLTLGTFHTLFHPAIWTVPVSQSTDAADFHREGHFWGKGKFYQKTVNKGEDKSKQTRLPTLFADLPENTLCPMCCFPSVDLVFVFTRLDSTSVHLKKKKHFGLNWLAEVLKEEMSK